MIVIPGKLISQSIPIKEFRFFNKLPAPYSEIVKATKTWEESDEKEADLDSIRAFFDLKLAEPALLDRERVCLLAAYGQLLIKSDNLSEAFTYCKQANDLAVETLVSEDLIRGYAQAGYGSYLDFYQVPELAVLSLEQSMKGISQINPEDAFPYRELLWMLFRNQIQLGLIEESKAYYEARLAQFDPGRRPIRKSRVHNTYGFFLQQAGYHEEAMAVFERGLATLSAADHEIDQVWWVDILETMSHSLIINGEFEKGISNIQQAYAIRKEQNRYQWAMQAMSYLIKYWLEAEQYQRAYQFYLQERDYFESKRSLTLRSYELYDRLGKLFEVLGDNKTADDFYATYNAFVRRKILPRMEAQLRTPKDLNEYIHLRNKAYEQELQIGQLEAEQLRKELELRQYGLVTLGLISFILLLLGLGWRWRNKREEQERMRAEADRRRILELENENLKYSVESQEKDIKQLAADNRLRTQIKRDMLRRIQEVSSLPSEKRMARLDKLIQELSRNVADETSVSEIQDQVEIINSAFENRLKDRIPGITAQEIRYCALLRLGMNNQQIAQMLNKSDATIRSYKYRVNKKADLANQDALKELVESL
ncbi:MAG: hypothetical protein AAGF87_15835 [Bacteroidota bacterium]